MQCPTNNTERVHLDITVMPTHPPPQPTGDPVIPPKLLAIMEKYKYNWRLNQLAKPRYQSQKYEPIIIGPDSIRKPTKIVKLKDDIKFFTEQMAWPKLRTLYINKNQYGHLKGYSKKYNKNIHKTWDTIYNFYKKRARDRHLRELRRHKKSKGKKPAIDTKRYDELSKPKPVFKPEPKKKQSKLFSNFSHLDELASPKPYHMEPPKSLNVNPAALSYEPTENIIKLAKVPDRMLNQPKPLEPGKVKRGALKYKNRQFYFTYDHYCKYQITYYHLSSILVTPNIEKLSQPKQRNEKSKDDEEDDPFSISKNALKYKATPRILELAKPVERD